MNFKVIVALLVTGLCTITTANPIFGLFSSRYSSPGSSGGYQGRSYNDIARVINPSPYAFPRQSPFPAQPFWTYTGWRINIYRYLYIDLISNLEIFCIETLTHMPNKMKKKKIHPLHMIAEKLEPIAFRL